MYYYEKIIKSGYMQEIEVYASIRKRKKICTRNKNIAISSEKQKIRNMVESRKRVRRLITNNFKPGDKYVTLTFKDDQTEESADRLLTNYIRRLQYHCKKNNIEFKYIGTIECGKRGNRWHCHIVMNDIGFDIISQRWNSGSVKVSSLYADGNYKDLANYITKDTGGKRRMKQSRNLIPPVVEVKEISKRDKKRIENGEFIWTPKNYQIAIDECEIKINEITGTAAYFVFLRRQEYGKRGS